MGLGNTGEEACFSLDFSDGFENWYCEMPGLGRSTPAGGQLTHFWKQDISSDGLVFSGAGTIGNWDFLF